MGGHAGTHPSRAGSPSCSCALPAGADCPPHDSAQSAPVRRSMCVCMCLRMSAVATFNPPPSSSSSSSSFPLSQGLVQGEAFQFGGPSDFYNWLNDTVLSVRELIWLVKGGGVQCGCRRALRICISMFDSFSGSHHPEPFPPLLSSLHPGSTVSISMLL